MRTCTTRSHPFTAVGADTYEEIKQQVSKGSFISSLQRSRRLLQDIEEERFLYQEEFSLPMKRTVFSLLSIPVYVNHVLCHFIVDTGAQISAVKAQCVQRLSMRQSGRMLAVGSIGGTQKQLEGVCADSLQIGALEYRKKAMVVLSGGELSLRFGSVDVFGFDGLIGWDILSTLDFELDDIGHRFKVMKNRFRFPHPNMIPGDFPLFLPQRANGDTLCFGFDSGSKKSWLGKQAAEHYDYHEEQEVRAFGFGVHGMEQMQVKLYDGGKLYLDRAEITLSHVMSGPTKLFDHFEFAGVFGNEIAKGRRIRLVNSASMVLLL